MDQVIEIAKVLRSRSLSHKMSGSVKEILGTCLCVAALAARPRGRRLTRTPPPPSSVGCTVDGMHPSDVTEKINNGEITIPDDE